MQPTADFQQQFQNALSLQQEKKYDEALTAYKSLLERNPDLSRDQIADISYNAALTSFSKQSFLESYVYNQKALLLKPSHSQASELAAKIKTQFQVKATPHDISLIENLNKAGLQVLPVEALWVLATLFLVMFLRSIFNYFLTRKKETLENLKFSRFSYKNYFWLVSFLIFSYFSGIKIWEEQTPKALIRSEQAMLKTAAGENQATLADLPGGSLVHILRVAKINDILYFQIKYPGGISGWTKKEDLELISAPKMPKD
ncbi:MAG: SH3-like domain-containing protein [Bdellovibrionota bacterium]